METAQIPPLRFEGTVTVAAHRSLVWSQLTTPDALERAAPGVTGSEIVEHDRRFRVFVSYELGGRQLALPVEIVWTERVPDESLAMEAAALLGSRAIGLRGRLTLAGDQDTTVTFSAETRPLPNSLNIPPTLLRTLIARSITTFFTNFKTEVELLAINN